MEVQWVWGVAEINHMIIVIMIVHVQRYAAPPLPPNGQKTQMSSPYCTDLHHSESEDM